ncbi:MAG: HlyD family efflux transporter periplasmic adaptor subunit [Candidatus Latescibacteria bacterium]|nr:HlyD family efflux transporter periplasmic adaptor subunit [Candidatus Latescibacterota bacterium]
MTQETTGAPADPSTTKKWLWPLLGLAVLAGLALTWSLLTPEESGTIASMPVQQDEFVISLDLKNGELEAIEAVDVVAPRVRGQLKIVDLFPEGEQVEVGDLLVKFELTEFEKRAMDAQQALEAAQAEMEKFLANQKAELTKLEGAIKDQDANLKLANLRVERMVFEAASLREETKIQAHQAQLSYKQAVQKLEAQKVVDAAEIRKLELNISREERDKEKAQRELESLTIKAEKPGLVVYGKVWKGERPEKIRIGDEIWGGVKLISLPNLSNMQVKTYVNEVDVDKLEVGQPVLIKLDALTEPTFHGTITTIASLGREKEGEKNVKVFDITVAIDEEDPRLKPGMSASAEVIVQTLPPRPESRPDSIQTPASEEVAASQPLPVFVPIDAVFEKNGEAVVYRIVDGVPKMQVVKLGPKNDDYVVIEEGLAPDDRIALTDPTQTAAGIGGLDDGDKSQSVSLE